jgi:hypothetical protein
MASARHYRQPFGIEPVALDLLRQRQQNVNRRIQRSGGELAFQFAAFRLQHADVDERAALGDDAHQLAEHRWLERIAHADGKMLRRFGGVEADSAGEGRFNAV